MKIARRKINIFVRGWRVKDCAFDMQNLIDTLIKNNIEPTLVDRYKFRLETTNCIVTFFPVQPGDKNLKGRVCDYAVGFDYCDKMFLQHGRTDELDSLGLNELIKAIEIEAEARLEEMRGEER